MAIGNTCNAAANGFLLSYVTALDTGTFGTVYRAVLLANGGGRGPVQTVAVKRIRSSGDGGRHELDVHKRLRHPNVVRLLFHFYAGNEDAEGTRDGGGGGGRPLLLHLVMEQAPTNLDRVIRHHASVGRRVSASYGRLFAYQLFRALAYVHGTRSAAAAEGGRLCHRDVKPRNLLVYPATGVLKLCDFGSAKDLADGRPNSRNVCSRRYRAPELLLPRRLWPAAMTATGDYTVAVDVWSAGCVYAELMTGAPAFPGDSVSHQRALVTRPPSVLSDASPRSSAAVRLVAAALRLDSASRPTARQACDHECFDQLRRPDVRLPDGRRLPRLFDDDAEHDDER